MVGSVSLVIFYHHYVLEIGVAVVAAAVVVQAPAVVDYDKIAIVYCKQTADFK